MALLLLCRLDTDYAQTESPYIEATVDVVDIALLNESAELGEIVFGLEEELIERVDRKGLLDVC